MRRTAALIILTGCLGALPWTAFGLGLGNIQLHSALGQKLNADIDLVGADQQAVAGLKVTLATPDQFKQAGVDNGQPILQALKFKVVEANGGWHVHVTSADPVREPFVTFLVDAQWPSGQVVREYTLLIDPPNYAGAAAPAATAPAATVSAAASTTQGSLQAQPAPTAAPQPAAPAIAASTPVSRGDNYGPIHRGATLWGIAQRLRAGTDIGIDQMMIALYRANPDAFSGNINRMKAGYVLRVPDATAIRNLDRREAIAAVREANHRYLAANAKPAAPAATAAAPSAATARLQLVAPAADDATSDATPGTEAGAAAAAVDQLKQQLAQAQQKAGDAAAANAKLSGQVDNLKKQLANTKRLLTVKDQQLSQLQAKVREQTAANDNTSSASLVDRAIALVTTPLVLVGLLAVIVLIVGGGFVWRQRRAKAAQAAAGSVVVSTEAAPAETDADDAEAAPEDATAPEEVEVFAGAAVADDTDDVLPAYDEPAGETSIDALLSDSQEAADPIAEADFHIDYGLYDQAAEIIRKAIEADPARDELILKLFRIYAAAADAPSYASAAQEFADWGAEHPAEWDEICAKGRELVPGEPLFTAGYLDPGATTMHATTASTEIGLDTATDIADTDTAADALADDTASPADPRDAALDFDLSGLSLDSDTPAAAEPAPGTAASVPSVPEPAAAEGGIEFDLSPEAIGRPELLGGDRLVDTQTEFEDAIKELSEFVDTNLPASAVADTNADPGIATTLAGADTDTGADEGDDFGGGFGADELDTKLDLARAYIDMGDPEGARAILQEVLEEGGEQHKEQAQSLLARVG